MSKDLEVLKCLERIKNLQVCVDYEKDIVKSVNEILPNSCNKVEQALQRLEAIDNANPSEALECLEKIIDNLDDYADFEIKQEANEYIATIKQALLKAQEPKKYLKWEDLEFKEMYKIIPVRMGDNVYQMAYCLYENEGYIRLEDCQRIYLELFANEKKFFNDLHLERVEE